MDTLIFANGLVSLGGAVVLSIIVLHRRIFEGVVIKLGLVAMIFSLLATAAHTLGGFEDWTGLWVAGFTLRLGLMVVGLGFLLRRVKKGSWESAMSDWGHP